jgi:hypothetical protein
MPSATTTTQATFRPRARLLSLLGEQLISDQAVGLIELVKLVKLVKLSTVR